MSKKIYYSEDDIERILLDIKAKLKTQKAYETLDIKAEATEKKKAKITFTTNAWIKLTALVNSFSTEVQWHGCVTRTDESEFKIYDIIVPPHTVTDATVLSDSKKYNEWITSLDDEIFDNLKFHGHSHVNMGCSPSGVDMKYRHDLVTQLPRPHEDEDSYYIFLIYNKKGEWTGEIYDVKYNTIYETSDTTIEVELDDGSTVSDFINEAKTLAVKEEPKAKVAETGKKSRYFPYDNEEKSYKDYLEEWYGRGR